MEMNSWSRRPNLRPAFRVALAKWRASITYVNLANLCKSCTCFDSRKARKTCQGHGLLVDPRSIADHQCNRAGHVTGPRISSIELETI